MQKCIEKIANGNGDLTYSVVTGTYPDHLFNKLLTEEKSPPDLFPLDLDEPVKSKSFQYALKRGVDIVGAIVGLLLFSPIMLLTAIAIKVTSQGPVIFRQIRFGHKRNSVSHFINSGPCIGMLMIESIANM